jgi:iron complex transport system substrate-binding protein
LILWKKSISSIATIVIIAVIIIVAACVGADYALNSNQSSSSNSTVTTSSSSVLFPMMNVTLVGLNGTKLVLSGNDISKLTHYTGNGGLRTKSGVIENVGNYTGIPLSSLVELVGGLTSSESVNVSGSDGYVITYSYQQVEDGQGFTEYNPLNGSSVNATQTLNLVLAYFVNGTQPLGSAPNGTGPLRTVVIGPQGLLTQGNLWVKWVVTVNVVNST